MKKYICKSCDYIYEPALVDIDGAVAAFDMDKGVISSGLCGFDINCGIKSDYPLMQTNATYNSGLPRTPVNRFDVIFVYKLVSILFVNFCLIFLF